MNNVILKRNYKTYITDIIPSLVSGEFALTLNDSPESSMWFLLVEPWTSKEESIFYHRSNWSTIYFYQVNRTWVFEHADNSQCLLVNSIDYMNYILWQLSESLFLYKISESDIVIKGWKFYIASQMVTLSDLNTSLNLTNKSLINWTTNYIYIDTVNLDFLITNVVRNDLFLVATLVVNGWWVIQSIIKEKVNHIWTIWESWPAWQQWPQWPTWLQWPAWVDWANVDLRVQGWYVQWKYSDQLAWYNLIAIADISWTSWVDGREVELQKWSTHIQWRYYWESDWINLVNLLDIKWDKWDIWEPWINWQTITDNVTAVTWSNVTTDNSTYIKVTLDSWLSYNYELTKIYVTDSNNETISSKDIVWTFWTDWITYVDNSFVNKLTWTVTFVGKPVYRDQDNTLEWVNTFLNTTIFKSNVSFPYYRIDMTWSNIINFNAHNWAKQRTINLTTWWTKTLNFNNLVTWENYMLCIVNNSWWNIILAKWTITNSWTIVNYSSIWWTTYPLTLSAWVHFFVCDAFDTAIHISYLWQSIIF